MHETLRLKGLKGWLWDLVYNVLRACTVCGPHLQIQNTINLINTFSYLGCTLYQNDNVLVCSHSVNGEDQICHFKINLLTHFIPLERKARKGRKVSLKTFNVLPAVICTVWDGSHAFYTFLVFVFCTSTVVTKL